MQNRYVGHIGDYGKYGLLRTLCRNDLHLGVVWYLNAQEQANTDGALVGYLSGDKWRLRECDPHLHEALGRLVAGGDRNVAAVQRGSILPSSTQYFAVPLPVGSGPCIGEAARAERLRVRDTWCHSAREATREAEVVFFDPDNGVAPASVGHHRADALKYAFLDELEPYHHRGQSLVIYQHANRDPGGFVCRLRSLVSRLKDELPAAVVWALRWQRQQARAYIVLAHTAHDEVLWERSCQLVTSPWGQRKHFALVDL
ncbi:MAG: hypothetical protein WCP21_01455 [Armatimonadota bacterium]